MTANVTSGRGLGSVASSMAVSKLRTANPAVLRLPRGFGLASGAVVSLAMWFGLVRLAQILVGA